MMDYEERDAMKALRGPMSQRATSAEFNEWCAREVCQYVDRLKAELEEAREIITNTDDYLTCEWFPHVSKKGNSRSAIRGRARAFLDKERT